MKQRQWIESFVHVSDHAVVLSIESLDDNERDRTAAVLAWLTSESAKGGMVEPAPWSEFVAEMVREHVTFTIAGVTAPERLGAVWWDEALGLAFAQFVRHNELVPRINRHLGTFRLIGAECLLES